MILKFEENNLVEYEGQQFVIAKAPTDQLEVLLRNPKNNTLFRAPIADVKYLSQNDGSETKKADPLPPIEALSEKDRKRAEYRFSIIEPLLAERGNKQAVINSSSLHKISVSTIYDWINRYEAAGSIVGLVDRIGRGNPGEFRLKKETLQIVTDVLDNAVANGSTFNDAYMTIWDRCELGGLEVPHHNTVRKHLKLYTAEQRVAGLHGPKTAKQKFGNVSQGMHESLAPLHWVEIDHTVADVMLVDPQTGETIGRPWITVLIDVYSRMILGYYASFDHPGAYGTGRAIVHAMLPKGRWLHGLGLDRNLWPCYGKMNNIRCDNAKEFKGNMLKEASLTYGMNFDFRAPKEPNDGPYIERFLGTFGKWLKNLSGSTAVSKELRSHGKPEKTATLSLEDFHKWLAIAIAIYHDDYHAGIQMSPRDKWNHGLFNKATGIGVPGIIQDEQRLLLDFLPFEKRTIQRTGVKIKKLFYWGDVLRKYINAIDEDVKGKHGSHRPKREFIFKIDPREISKIYFLEPELKKYFEIPYSKISGPSMSIWDYRRAVVDLRKNGEEVNQDNIFARHRMQNQVQENAKKRTKQARKDTARKDQMKKEANGKVATPKSETMLKTTFTIKSTEIKPFEIDYGTKSFK